jgi:hypothetical protein
MAIMKAEPTAVAMPTMCAVWIVGIIQDEWLRMNRLGADA